jgi:hypothetical protein
MLVLALKHLDSVLFIPPNDRHSDQEHWIRDDSFVLASCLIGLSLTGWDHKSSRSMF